MHCVHVNFKPVTPGDDFRVALGIHAEENDVVKLASSGNVRCTDMARDFSVNITVH